MLWARCQCRKGTGPETGRDVLEENKSINTEFYHLTLRWVNQKMLAVPVQSAIRRLPNTVYPTGKNPWQDTWV
jgi:hypothetical protein